MGLFKFLHFFQKTAKLPYKFSFGNKQNKLFFFKNLNPGLTGFTKITLPVLKKKSKVKKVYTYKLLYFLLNIKAFIKKRSLLVLEFKCDFLKIEYRTYNCLIDKNLIFFLLIFSKRILL